LRDILYTELQNPIKKENGTSTEDEHNRWFNPHDVKNTCYGLINIHPPSCLNPTVVSSPFGPTVNAVRTLRQCFLRIL